jgi:polyisoprenoid-binding protein YceI
MKNFIKITAALAVLAFVSFSFKMTEVASYGIDIKESVIVWKAQKVTGSHTGTVALKSGDLVFTDGMLTGGMFEIDMQTIDCTDLQGEWKDKLVGHLKSADFFGVENHPTAKFVMTNVISRGKPGEYKVVGDLTIKETTKEIKFNAMIEDGGESKTGMANITIDRSDFDIRYGSGSFFDNLGDKTIYDEFDLEITLVVNK